MIEKGGYIRDLFQKPVAQTLHCARRCWRTINQGDDSRVAPAVQDFLQSHLQRAELPAVSIRIHRQKASGGEHHRLERIHILAATTMINWQCGRSDSMAAPRKVFPCQVSKALSRCMRVDSPAARMTAARMGARAML